MLSINTNTSSLFAQNSLAGAQNTLAASVQRLSSGLRINSGADDAAGLSISQNLQSQINGVNQSIQGLSNATSLLQVADSSLASIHDMLSRMKQLATQGYDGSLSSRQRLDIANELDSLNSEINATAQRTQFNGVGIIASGLSVDAVSSSIKIGTDLNGGVVSDIRLSGAAAGTYQLTKIGTSQIKLTNTSGTGQTISQTITLKNNAQNEIQTLNFESMGIAIDVQSYQAQTFTQIAEALVAVAGGSSSTTITSSGFTSATNTINLNSSNGYVLTIDGNQYSTKGTVNGVADARVATLNSTTTIDALAAWINNLQQNFNINANASITGSGSSYALEITSTSATSSASASGILETVTSSNPAIITATAGADARGGINIVNVEGAAAKTWTLTSSSANISLDTINGFQLSVGGVNYKSVPALSSATTLTALASWINGLRVPASGSPDMPVTASVSGNTLTLTGPASAAGNFTVDGVASQTIGGFTSPDNSISIAATGLQLNIGGASFNSLSATVPLNQTSGFSSLSDIVDWVNALNAGVTASIANDGIASYSLSLLQTSGAPAAISFAGLRPGAIEANFSSPNDAVTLDSVNGFKVVSGAGTFSTKDIAHPIVGSRVDGAVTLNDLANWVSNLNAGLVGTIVGGNGNTYSLGVSYAASNSITSAISISGIVNGTTSSDEAVALATANAGAVAGAHPLVVTQTAAATSCNLAGFMDENALVDVSNFDLFVGGNVYYANGNIARGASVSIYLPGQGGQTLQNNINTSGASWSYGTALGDWSGESVWVTIGQLRDWINALGDNVQANTLLAPSGDTQLHINGTQTGAGNVVGFDNLGNIAVSYDPYGWGSISTNYTNSTGGNYIAGTISLTANGGIAVSSSPAPYMLQGGSDAYQVVDSPRGIVYDGTTYFWAGPPSAVDPNYVNDSSRGLIDPGNGLWYGQPEVVLDTSQGSFLGPNPDLAGQINPDGVVNFNGNWLTGDPGINTVIVARDAKGTIDGRFFQSATNTINNAANTNINLILTGVTTPSDRATNANIVVDQGISNTPSVLSSSTVSVNEGADAKNATLSINGVSYDPSLQTIRVGGVTYSYLGGTSASPITVSVLPISERTVSSSGGDGIVVSSKGNSALEFQSGATSNFHVTVYTSNVMTGNSGANAGSLLEMIALGNSFTTKGNENIHGLSASDSLDTWQSAFKRLSSLIDGASDRISAQRAVYGSQLNTISFNVSDLQSQSVALQKSKSSIMDADFALETAKLAKGQILQQSSTAILAQANQEPNVIIGLLSRSFSSNYNIQNFVY
jgi:flagellin